MRPAHRSYRVSRPDSESTHRGRRGVAVSELALCLPLFVLVVFSGIETADMVFLKESLKSATYEGGRAGAKWNSTNADITQRVNVLLDAKHVQNATLVIELPGNANDVSQLSRGEIFNISISAPAAENTVGPLKLFAGRTISANTRMVRE